jgi:hypothetical protein
MVSMAMSYFYSWQTYSLNDAWTGSHAADYSEMEVVAVSFGEVVKHTRNRLFYCWHNMCLSGFCQYFSRMVKPMGRGGFA